MRVSNKLNATARLVNTNNRHDSWKKTKVRFTFVVSLQFFHEYWLSLIKYFIKERDIKKLMEIEFIPRVTMYYVYIALHKYVKIFGC